MLVIGINHRYKINPYSRSRLLPSARAQGFGDASPPVHAIAVWTLAVPAACGAPSLTGVANHSVCHGKIWGGQLKQSSGVRCEDACRGTLGCRSFSVFGKNGTAYCETCVRKQNTLHPHQLNPLNVHGRHRTALSLVVDGTLLFAAMFYLQCMHTVTEPQP